MYGVEGGTGRYLMVLATGSVEGSTGCFLLALRQYGAVLGQYGAVLVVTLAIVTCTGSV